MAYSGERLPISDDVDATLQPPMPGYVVVAWSAGVDTGVAATSPTRISEIDDAVLLTFVHRAHAQVLPRVFVIGIDNVEDANALFGALDYVSRSYPGELAWVLSPAFAAVHRWAGRGIMDWEQVNGVTAGWVGKTADEWYEVED